MWKCLICGADNRDDRDTCWKCGTIKGISQPETLSSERGSIIPELPSNRTDSNSVTGDKYPVRQTSAMTEKELSVSPLSPSHVGQPTSLSTHDMFCPSCGKEIPENSTFCLHCGKPIYLSRITGGENHMGVFHLS